MFFKKVWLMQWYALALIPKGFRPSLGTVREQAAVPWHRLRLMRDLSHWFWMSKGSRAFEAGDWEIASRCYTKAVRARPDDSSAWEQRILAVLMMGCGETADLLIDEANELVSLDNQGLVLMKLYSAWLKEDTERIRCYLSDLAKMDVHLARAAANHLIIDTQELDPPLGPGSSDDRHDWIDGYA